MLNTLREWKEIHPRENVKSRDTIRGFYVEERNGNATRGCVYCREHRMRWSSFTNGFSSALNWSSAATVPNNHITVHTSTGRFKNGPKIT